MQKYRCGDILELKNDLTRYADSDKHPILIREGMKFRVGYNVQYPECAYYELIELTDNNPLILQEWNDEGHEVLDDNFKVVGFYSWSELELNSFLDCLEEYKKEMQEETGQDFSEISMNIAPIYVHYGHEEFDPYMCTQRVQALKSKPDMGLWASREDADFGWKDWCIGEEYKIESLDTHFDFILAQNANILEVHSESDILKYIKKNKDSRVFKYPTYGLTDILDELDIERLYKDFDGIELFISEDYNTMHFGIFNSWDCDSICVWNPSVIIPGRGFV